MVNKIGLKSGSNIMSLLKTKNLFKSGPFQVNFKSKWGLSQLGLGLAPASGFRSFSMFSLNFGPDPNSKLSKHQKSNDFLSLKKLSQNFDQSRRHYETIAEWKDLSGHEYVHLLTDKTISSFLYQNETVLIMFYAPWCFHCKNVKPEFAKAAKMLNVDLPHAKLAAIDCTLFPSLNQKYEVAGYPTIKYYKNGKLIGEYHHRRIASDFVHFMIRDPRIMDDL